MKLVVIGGSSGIGRATARAARNRGWDVVVASRDPERTDLDVETVTLDVTDRDAVRRVFQELGPIDHLVSTTVARAGGPVRELDLDAARQAFETKLWGPLSAIQSAQVQRSIVLISGVAAWTPMVGGAATAAVNGAIEALVRTLAVELAPVRVNAVSPGIIDTPTWPPERRDALFSHLSSTLPVGRIGGPEEIAQAILFLLENDFTTGSVLHVDGGHRLAAP